MKNQLLKLSEDNKKLNSLIADFESENSNLKEINRSLSGLGEKQIVEIIQKPNLSNPQINPSGE